MVLSLSAADARRNLSTIDCMQCLAPSAAFVFALFLFDEPFTVDHAVIFACTWMALTLFSSFDDGCGRLLAREPV